jgi:hypothetical protein
VHQFGRRLKIANCSYGVMVTSLSFFMREKNHIDCKQETVGELRDIAALRQFLTVTTFRHHLTVTTFRISRSLQKKKKLLSQNEHLKIPHLHEQKSPSLAELKNN